MAVPEGVAHVAEEGTGASDGTERTSLPDSEGTTVPSRGPHPAAQALDRLTEGVFSLGPDATVLHANTASLGMAERELDEVVGRSLWEIFPHLREGEFAEHLKHAVDRGEVHEYESFTPRVGRWLRRRFYPAVDGVTVLLGEGPSSVLSRDEHHELRQSLERAQAAEQRYRDILDEMTEGVSETTPAGDFLVVNASFAVMLGYDDAEDLLSQVSNASELYAHPQERAAAVSRVEGGGPTSIEVEMRRRDGRTVWVRVRATPTYATTGEVHSLRGVVEDITEQREADRRLREAEERIGARERKLLAEAVHDEPLQLVVAAILRLDGLKEQLDPERVEPAEHILSLLELTVDRLRNLIVALAPPDLTHGLADALHVFANGIFMGTSTTIEVSGATHVPLTDDVKHQAYRVLSEALVNARKHASAGRVQISLAVEDTAVTLSVSDDGVGGASAAADPGHLGMTTMFSRAESAGGTLHVESPPGAGTTVELVLPRRRD